MLTAGWTDTLALLPLVKWQVFCVGDTCSSRGAERRLDRRRESAAGGETES